MLLDEPLILASQSPRRRDLLTEAGIPFEVIVQETNELHDSQMDPETLCALNASEKADIIAQQFPTRLVLGADTLVFIDNQALGKPADLEEAKSMLRSLAGRSHKVCTAVALRGKGVRINFAEHSEVRFKPLSDEQIDHYLASVYVLDKAGSYAMQEKSELIIESISGCMQNVIGLPVPRLKEVLASLAKQ